MDGRGSVFCFVACAAVVTGCASGRGLPPLWEHETDLPGKLEEDRAAFGIASRTRGPDGALLSALRPFVAKVEDGQGALKLHALPPFGSHTENTYAEHTRLFPLFFDSEAGDEADRRERKSDDDTWLFPLLAWGRDPEEGSYFAAFPVYGTLKGKLLADRIDFVLFPAYAHTKAGAWESTHVLWPLIAWGDGPERTHRRFLPFWSQSSSPRKEGRTLLWPFIHWSAEVRGERTFDSWFVFPLAGRRTSRDGTFAEWTALYPFFEFSHDELTGDDYRAILWPFHKRYVKPGVSESTWWWPFYGTFDSEEEHSAFYAWPIVWATDEERNGYAFRHRYVVPVWMRREVGKKGEPPSEIEVRSWPLFSWRTRPDGYHSGRVPEIVPFFGWEAGETCYADLVSLVRWSSDRDGREAWDSILGLVRYRRTTTGRKTLTLLWWLDIPLGGGS